MENVDLYNVLKNDDHESNISKNKILSFFSRNLKRLLITAVIVTSAKYFGIDKNIAAATAAAMSGDLGGCVDLIFTTTFKHAKLSIHDIYYIAKGKHPYQSDNKNDQIVKSFYIGKGVSLTKMVLGSDINQGECSEPYCIKPAVLADKGDAEDFCQDNFKGRLPTINELSKTYTGKTPLRRLAKKRLGMENGYAEWSSSSNNDKFAVLHKNVLKKALKEIVMFIDDGYTSDKLGFRCAFDMKLGTE